METSVIAGWTDFLIAAAGAVGALAGLVFVSLSINLARIIELPGSVGRAVETIIVLAGSLAGALVCLMPHFSSTQLALVLAPITLITWGGPLVIQIRLFHSRKYYLLRYEIIRAVMHQAATLPGVIAILALCGLLPGGIAWFAAGVVISMLVAILNAWVLLVEILR